MANWAAIEQALHWSDGYLEALDDEGVRVLRRKIAEALAAVGEAKRRESELEERLGWMKAGNESYKHRLGLANYAANEAEARVAELERALNWLAVEWAKWAENTADDPHPDLVQGGIDAALEAARREATGE